MRSKLVVGIPTKSIIASCIMVVRVAKVTKSKKVTNHQDMKKMKVFKRNNKESKEVALDESSSICRTLRTWSNKADKTRFQVGF